MVFIIRISHTMCNGIVQDYTYGYGDGDGDGDEHGTLSIFVQTNGIISSY